MKVLTADQMRDVDRLTTERYGVPSLQLMENAGTRVVEFLEAEFGNLAGRSVAILCGKGNNGGDGLVVARLLRERGCHPRVYLFAAPESVRGDAAVNLKKWSGERGEGRGEIKIVALAADWDAVKGEVASAEIIVDALLGTGLTGPVEGFLRGVISDLNEVGSRQRLVASCPKIVAVDIPSGVASDSGALAGPAIRAQATVTFTAPKLGLVLPPACEHAGKLVVRGIGSPVALLDEAESKTYLLGPEEFRTLPLARPPGGHKGDYGHAFIVAGSRGKSGAAVLAAWGALRAGAGLVTVATPEKVQPVVAAGLPEMMTEALAGTDADTIAVRSLDFGRFFEILRGKSVLALGPGLSTHPETQQFVHRVVAECALPVILDADGLNAFAGRAAELSQRHSAALAVTPHPGEMARLLGCTTAEVQAQRLEVAQRAAREWNAHVVLKGYRTVVTAPDGRAFINPTGNPGMASGGTGDVLTGILAGLTAQFGVADWARVLSLGVYLHGLAGDFAAAEVGEHSLVASDLVRMLPRAFLHLRAGTGHG
jgi:hydroxyethylthiazole kinase-like uncharacterized protein yjeF